MTAMQIKSLEKNLLNTILFKAQVLAIDLKLSHLHDVPVQDRYIIDVQDFEALMEFYNSLDVDKWDKIPTRVATIFRTLQEQESESIKKYGAPF